YLMAQKRELGRLLWQSKGKFYITEYWLWNLPEEFANALRERNHGNLESGVIKYY
ncbi:hypothetical protein ACTXT7_015359, partial [Hymenolepis weldensis]